MWWDEHKFCSELVKSGGVCVDNDNDPWRENYDGRFHSTLQIFGETFLVFERMWESR